MKDSFLINNSCGKKLYNKIKNLPIIDYHNHLSLEALKKNTAFTNIFDLWIAPDPYKHRAMRMCGVEEKYITGDADCRDKFLKWCETLPKLVGGPLYHWSRMEIEFLLESKDFSWNDDALYERLNTYLQKNKVTPKSLINKFNVQFNCPCASLVDDISFCTEDAALAPSLRGDDIVYPSLDFINKLEKITNTKISDLASFETAIRIRLNDFYKIGCRFTDHALDNGFTYFEDDGLNEARFINLLEEKITPHDIKHLSSHILVKLAESYARAGFVMQLHIGAQRTTSTRLRKIAGKAGGYAAIGNSVNIDSLTKFLDDVEALYKLPKTVLFTLNPSDNAIISVLSGSYSQDEVKGLITQGPAWWWCDHKNGIENMLENWSSFGVLSNFIGMTTDSRSFLSFVRHDYFRRILCNWLGEKKEKGEIFEDEEELYLIAEKICYSNAKEI